MDCDYLFPCKFDATSINYGLCPGCLKSLENALIANFSNFDTPETFTCVECGDRLLSSDLFVQHVKEFHDYP